MDRDTAISKILEHEILPHPLISTEACPAIVAALELIWQAGYDSAAKKLMSRHKTPVRLVSLDGKTLATYDSIEQAARDTGYGYTGIKSALKRHSRTMTGYYWEYVQEAEVKELWRYAEVG